MKTGDTYPRNTALAVLLGGNPGSGKTVACFSFPDPFTLDCEGNLKSAIRMNPDKRFWWDNPELDKDGKPVAADRVWLRMIELLREAGAKPDVRTIIVDGLGRVTVALKDYLIAQSALSGEKMPTIAGEKQMSQTTWQEYERKLTQFVMLVRSFGKPVVVTCHFKVDENDLTSVKEHRVDIQGRLTVSFPKLFTDFLQTMAVPSSDAKYGPPKGTGVRYYIRAAPTTRIELKCSCGLPAEFELPDKCWQDVMATLVAAPPPTPVEAAK